MTSELLYPDKIPNGIKISLNKEEAKNLHNVLINYRKIKLSVTAISLEHLLENFLTPL